MANANRKHMGPSDRDHGKGSGEGAMTPESVADERLGENQALKNRDKAQHSDARGLDSRGVQTDQMQDQPMNRQRSPDDAPLENTSGLSGPKSTTSGADSSLESRRGRAGGLAEEPDERSGGKD